MTTYQTMDERTLVAFLKLKALLGRKVNEEIFEAKSAVRVLKGNFDPEADSKLDMVVYHLDQGSHAKAEEAFPNFCGIIGAYQPARNTFG